MTRPNTYFVLSKAPDRPLPPDLEPDDIRYPERLVELFLHEYTRPGDVVLDPFAGFGTTLQVAESLDRLGFGLEYDERRCEFAGSQLRHPERLICGDSRRLSSYDFPACDFSMTSPPYMARGDPEDPLAAYTVPGRGYHAYLADIEAVYLQVRARMKAGARAVLEVANLKGPSGVTTLAWDVALAVGRVLTFEGEIVIGWDRPYGYGYDHSYCLVFRKAGHSPSREGPGER